jgi:hypothetical protein
LKEKKRGSSNFTPEAKNLAARALIELGASLVPSAPGFIARPDFLVAMKLKPGCSTLSVKKIDMVLGELWKMPGFERGRSGRKATIQRVCVSRETKA